MSGASIASYALAAAQRARLRELERQERMRRRWRLVQAQREQLAAWSWSVARQYGQPAVTVPSPGEPRSLDQGVVDQQVAAAEGETARLRRQVAGQVAAGRDRWARRLVSGIGDGLEPDQAGSTTAVRRTRPAAPAAPSGREEASRLLGRLDPDIEIPSAVRRLVTGLGTAPPSRRPVLLASLRDHIQVLNQQARRRRETAATLAELALLVRETGDRPLRAALDQAQAEAGADRPVDLAGLRAEAEAAERRQEAHRDREHVRRSLLAALANLDYQTVPEEAVAAAPGAAMLVRRPDGSPRHAVRVTVNGGDISFESVRLTDADDPAGVAEPDERERAEDLAAEQLLCAHVPRVVAAVPHEDVEIGRVRVVVPAGAERPPRVVARGLPSVPERAGRQEPRQRRLDRPG